MPDVSNYDLLKTPDAPPPQQRSAGFWIVVALLVGAAAIAAFIVFGRRAPAPAPAAERATAPRPAVKPLGGDAEPIVLPPLDQSDALVRELVTKISSHPRVAAWLATDNLIRGFTIHVANVAEGKTPARQLPMLRPTSAFRVIERGGVLIIDPRSYERYDALAAAAASMDPQGTARLYATLKPRIEEAYRELGDQPFDRPLERAIVQLLNTPVVDDPIRVEPRGIGYGFVDPRLEALTGAQKQLLRTGPRNVRVFQTSLRAIALALGIPPERLPGSAPGRGNVIR
jgi:hypothetical protein